MLQIGVHPGKPKPGLIPANDGNNSDHFNIKTQIAIVEFYY